MSKFPRVACAVAGLGLCAGQAAHADALVSYWDFNQNDGGTLNDVVGDNDGALYNGGTAYTSAGDDTDAGPEFVAGRPGAGNAMRFNDSTHSGATIDIVELGNGSFPTGVNDFTLSGWFNANDAGSGHGYLISNGVFNNSGLELHVQKDDGGGNSGKLVFGIKGASSSNVSVLSDAAVDDGQWHWFAAVVKDQVAYLYVDGAEQASAAYKANTSASPAESSTYFGARIKNTEGFDGLLDDVAVFDYALSAEELNILYAEGPLAVPEPGAMGLISLGVVGLLRRQNRQC